MKTLIYQVYDAFGDWISCNGMIRHLSKDYDKVILVLDTDGCLSFVKDLFKDNSKVDFVSLSHYHNMCSSHEDFDVIDVRVNETYSHPGNTGSYFSKNNHYGNYRAEKITDNASGFYINLGFSPEIRIKDFYYERDYESEEKLCESLNLPNDYAVICEMEENMICRDYIKSENIINLHRITDNFAKTIRLIENAKEVHLIENSISLLVYHMQMIGKMKSIPVNLHTYARKESHRQCDGPNCNNKFLNMLRCPMIDNWRFIWK